MNLNVRMQLWLLLSILLTGSILCWPQTTMIDPQSVTSLELKILNDRPQLGTTDLGTATGFVIDKNNKHYLVTNRHVVLHCGEDHNPTNVGGWICANKIGTGT